MTIDFQDQITQHVVSLLRGAYCYYGVIESQLEVGSTNIYLCFEYDNTGIWLTQIDYSEVDWITTLNQNELQYLTRKINGELSELSTK